MSQSPEPAQPSRSSVAEGVIRALGAVALVVYTVLLMVRMPASWPEWLRSAGGVTRGWIYVLVRMLGAPWRGHDNYPEIQAGLYFLVVGAAIPFIVLLLTGRFRPRDWGVRRPNRVGWRILVVGFLVTIPFLFWVASGEKFARMYVPQYERIGPVVFLAFYLTHLACEHFFFHGVLLTLTRPGWRWPAAAPVVQDATSRWRRVLQWCGLAQPAHGATGGLRWTRWVGLPDGCVLAVLVSAFLFVLAHFGKDVREIWVSAPGGLALAYAAYRTNTWLTAALLHGLAAGASFVILMVLTSGVSPAVKLGYLPSWLGGVLL